MRVLVFLIFLFGFVDQSFAGYRDCAIIHEKAHCCGWDGRHTGAGFLPGCGRIYMPPAQFMGKTCKNPIIISLDAASVASRCLGNTIACSHVSRHATNCPIYINKDVR